MASAGSLSKGSTFPRRLLGLVLSLAVGVPVGVSFGLAWLVGLAWLDLTLLELGLAWLGLAWLGLASVSIWDSGGTVGLTF